MNVNSSEKVYVLCQGEVVKWSKWMEMEEGCIFEVMPPMRGTGNKKKKEEEKHQSLMQGEGRKTENLELEHFEGGDGLAEKGGEESGWKEDSGEKRFEKVDVRQLKEMMGDTMIMVENLVSMPQGRPRENSIAIRVKC